MLRLTLRFSTSTLGLLLLTTAASAQLVVPSYFDGAVYKYSPTGGGLQQTYFSSGNSYTSGPAGVTVGPDGNIYISNEGSPTTPSSIIKYNPSNGQTSTVVTAATLSTVVGGGYYGSTAIRFGSDGELYVARNGGTSAADGSGAIDRFNPTTGLYLGTVATGLSQPTNMTINNGTLYVSNLRGSSGYGSVVSIANYATAVNATATTFIPALTGGLENPTGIAFGPNGKFYVADISYVGISNEGPGSNCQILQFNANGTNPVTFVSAAVLQGLFPSDLLFNTDGTLIDANVGYPGQVPGTILGFNSSGAQVSTILFDSNVSPGAIALFPTPEPGMLLFVGAMAAFGVRRRIVR